MYYGINRWVDFHESFATTSLKKVGGLIFEGGPSFERLWYCNLYINLHMSNLMFMLVASSYSMFTLPENPNYEPF